MKRCAIISNMKYGGPPSAPPGGSGIDLRNLDCVGLDEIRCG